jgi:hypothetical protein
MLLHCQLYFNITDASFNNSLNQQKPFDKILHVSCIRLITMFTIVTLHFLRVWTDDDLQFLFLYRLTTSNSTRYCATLGLVLTVELTL